MFVYAIAAVQDAYPAFRPHLGPAWQIDKKWQHHEPGECRPVISAPVVQAMTSIALLLLWNWPRFAGVLLIGILCMLHPSKYLVLTRGNLLLPADTLSLDRVAYVFIRNPKTARFARRQHSKLEDGSVLSFLGALEGHLDFDARLHPGSHYTSKSQWNAILRQLGIPFTQSSKRITLGDLRGSGAVHFYLEMEDLVRIAWRGHWARQTTLQLAAQMITQLLPPPPRNKIFLLSRFSSKLVFWFVSKVALAAKHHRDGQWFSFPLGLLV